MEKEITLSDSGSILDKEIENAKKEFEQENEGYKFSHTKNVHLCNLKLLNGEKTYFLESVTLVFKKYGMLVRSQLSPQIGKYPACLIHMTKVTG